jgi:hypothetical protein
MKGITIETIFDCQISSIILSFSEDEDIFLKFCVINKNFNKIIFKMKNYDKIWKDKFFYEFSCELEQSNGIILKQMQKDLFLRRFPDF